MTVTNRSDSERSESPAAPIKGAFPVAAVNDVGLFKRTEGKTFDSDSLDEYYKPIDSYEVAHR